LLASSAETGRNIADQLRLPFKLTKDVLQVLRDQLTLAYCGSAPMSDYEYELTETGHKRARRYAEQCSYYGTAPVTLEQYVSSVEAQSVQKARLRIADLCNAYGDLYLPPSVISQIGQAVDAGQGLFLYGDPGNGKTSIAERVIGAVSQHLWIPRTLKFASEIMRLYDPYNHEERPLPADEELLKDDVIDTLGQNSTPNGDRRR